jgi:hypothetical protein
MNRRHFIALSGTASMAVVSPALSATETGTDDRQVFELRQYHLEQDEQRQGLDAFLKTAAIPALNRLGIKQVGVFYQIDPKPTQCAQVIYVLIPHVSSESAAMLTETLRTDQEFLTDGAGYINATAAAPAYKRMESSLMLAFRGMPRLETPVKAPGRVFQLRIYESPSERTNFKKIEMFNEAGEIRIFREVGLNPVFFGRVFAGAKMPNLTYMLAFKNTEEQQAAWKRFGEHPDWKRLREMQEYSDKAILSGIMNLSLTPAEYSQI